MEVRLPVKPEFCSFRNIHYHLVIRQPHAVYLHKTQAFLRPEQWCCSVNEKLFSILVYTHYSVSLYLFVHILMYMLFSATSYSSIPYVMS